MRQLNELLHKRMSRRRFPVALGVGLTTLIGLLRLARGNSDEEPAPADEQLPPTPNYGAWRPRTAGDSTMPTV